MSHQIGNPRTELIKLTVSQQVEDSTLMRQVENIWGVGALKGN